MITGSSYYNDNRITVVMYYNDMITGRTAVLMIEDNRPVTMITGRKTCNYDNWSPLVIMITGNQLSCMIL